MNMALKLVPKFFLNLLYFLYLGTVSTVRRTTTCPLKDDQERFLEVIKKPLILLCQK